MLKTFENKILKLTNKRENLAEIVIKITSKYAISLKKRKKRKKEGKKRKELYIIYWQ